MKRRILCYGDSNTYGYVPHGEGKRYDESIRWTAVLQKRLGAEYTVIEDGLSGRTVDVDIPGEPWKNGLAYLYSDLSTHRPVDLITVMLGTNDLKVILDRDVKLIVSGMNQMIQNICEFMKTKQGFVPKILLMSPPHFAQDVDRLSDHEFDERSLSVSKLLAPEYRKIAEQYDCLFLDSAEVIHTSEKDGVHLDPDQHEVFGKVIAGIISEWFNAHPEFSAERKAMEVHR